MQKGGLYELGILNQDKCMRVYYAIYFIFVSIWA